MKAQLISNERYQGQARRTEVFKMEGMFNGMKYCQEMEAMEVLTNPIVAIISQCIR